MEVKKQEAGTTTGWNKSVTRSVGLYQGIGFSRAAATGAS